MSRCWTKTEFKVVESTTDENMPLPVSITIKLYNDGEPLCRCDYEFERAM